jgi:type VI secretion system protein VasJ
LRFELLQPLVSLLARLRQTAEERALQVWEPELAVALASLSWRSLTHKNAKRFFDEREGQEQRARIMSTLAELDIVAAARLSATPAP